MCCLPATKSSLKGYVESGDKRRWSDGSEEKGVKEDEGVRRTESFTKARDWVGASEIGAGLGLLWGRSLEASKQGQSRAK